MTGSSILYGRFRSHTKMTTKEKILELFETHKGIYFSGEEMAQRLCVSRAAIWKAVSSLRSEGYPIDAATNKGYCLSAQTDILSPQGIRKYLSPACGCLRLTVLPTVSSTNAQMREMAMQGAPEGEVLLADEQTSGRGRYGRSFYSPGKTGIYMSLLLRPQQYSAQQAVRLTTMAAAAMCEAIEEVSGRDAQIKWVNDILMGGKKVCGILTEASFGLESGLLDFAVLGLGVNVYPPEQGFPDDLADIAGSVFANRQNDVKNQLAGTFLSRFMAYYAAPDPSVYTDAYRQRCFAVGKTVQVSAGGHCRSAYVYGLDEACRLLVRYEDGEEGALTYGEIQVQQ